MSYQYIKGILSHPPDREDAFNEICSSFKLDALKTKKEFRNVTSISFKKNKQSDFSHTTEADLIKLCKKLFLNYNAYYSQEKDVFTIKWEKLKENLPESDVNDFIKKEEAIINDSSNSEKLPFDK